MRSAGDDRLCLTVDGGPLPPVVSGFGNQCAIVPKDVQLRRLGQRLLRNGHRFLPGGVHHGAHKEGQIGLQVNEHIEEGPVQIDHIVVRLHHGAFIVDLHRCGGAGLGSLAVHTDIGLVEHPVDEQIAVCGMSDAGEVRFIPVKGIGHAHGFENIGHLNIKFRFKFGHCGLHHSLIGIGQQVVQVLAGKAFQILLHGNPRIGQQGGEGIAPAYIGLDKALGFIVCQKEAFLGVHHLHFPSVAPLGGELPVTNVRFAVNLLPLGIKGQGIDQVHHRAFGNLVENILDHAVGVFFHPGIDFLAGALVEGGLENARPVVIGIGLQKIFIYGEPLGIPEPDGVGQLQLPGELIAVAAQPQVQGFHIQAENRLHLGKCIPLCAVGGHGQGIQDAQGRDQGIPVRGIAFPEQIQSEICQLPVALAEIRNFFCLIGLYA